MSPKEYPEDSPIPENAHRLLWVITWVLITLGLLEWFVLGANRPLDPVLVPGIVLPVVLRQLTR